MNVNIISNVKCLKASLNRHFRVFQCGIEDVHSFYGFHNSVEQYNMRSI